MVSEGMVKVCHGGGGGGGEDANGDVDASGDVNGGASARPSPIAAPSDLARKFKVGIGIGSLALALVVSIAVVVAATAVSEGAHRKRVGASAAVSWLQEPTVAGTCEELTDRTSCREGVGCLWVPTAEKCISLVPEAGAAAQGPSKMQSTQPTPTPTIEHIRTSTKRPTVTQLESPRSNFTIHWNLPGRESNDGAALDPFALGPLLHDVLEGSYDYSHSPSQMPSQPGSSSVPSRTKSIRPSWSPASVSTSGPSQTLISGSPTPPPSLTSTSDPSQRPSIPSVPTKSYSTTTATVTRIDASTTLTVSRIDARPPGHPFDSGTEPDPIFDYPYMLAAGAASKRKDKTQLTGPSVIRVPDWIPPAERAHPDAVYYMYYAAHGSTSIRLAWAATITGEWRLFNRGDAPDRAWGAKGNYTGRRTPGSGVLDLHLGDYGATWFDGDFGVDDHIASPDVHVDSGNRRLILYFHGPMHKVIGRRGTGNFVATSKWGLNFNLPEEGGEEGHGPRNVLVSGQYLKTFDIEGRHLGEKVTRTFGFVNGGELWAAPLRTDSGEPATHANADERGGFFTPSWPGDPTPMEHPHKEPGSGAKPYWWTKYEAWGPRNPLRGVIKAPGLVPPDNPYPVREKHQDPRHFAIYHDPVHDRDRVYIFYTCRRDLPESVVLVVLDLSGLEEEDRLDPSKWGRVNDVEHVVLRPETVWEGVADFSYKHSASGAGQGYQLRDPDVFRDRDGKIYLFYCGRGEGAIGVAEVTIDRRVLQSSPRVAMERPSLEMISPARGYTCFAGMRRIIAWETKGDVPRVDVEYTLDGSRWIAITRGAKNENYFQWKVPDASSDVAQVRVRASIADRSSDDGSNNGDDRLPSAVSEQFFVAPDDGSTLFLIRPHGGATITAGSSFSLNWASEGDVSRVDLAYIIGNGREEGGGVMLWKTIANAVSRPFLWQVPDIEAEGVRIRIRGTKEGQPEFVGDPFRIISTG